MNSLSRFVGKIVSERPAIKGGHIENLDGLRAIAALMVMSMHMHTIPGSASGFTGVYLFFALSGYLLYSGFLRFCDTINASTIFAYLTRRVFRIIPLYLFFAFTYAYLFKGWSPAQENDFFFSQLFFYRHILHLWTVQIEMILYLFLPFIIIFISFFKNGVARSTVLIGIACLSLILYYNYAVSIVGTQYYIAIFLLGMAAVHLKDFIPEKLAPAIAYISFIMIFLLSLYIPQTAPLRSLFGLHNLHTIYEKAYVFFAFSFLLLMALARFKSRFWGNKWLRLVGVCGYGYYLWHPMMIEVAAKLPLSAVLFQTLAYFSTLFIAIITYLLIEKPLIGVGRFLSDKIKENKAVFLGVRPWVICVLFTAAFFSYRCLYVFDGCYLQFNVTICPPEDTVAQVFIPYENHYNEDFSHSVGLKGKEWQTITFKLNAQQIHAFRFDPGTAPGEYKIKDFSVTPPLTGTSQSIDIKKLIPENDIQSFSFHEDYLAISTKSAASDPILIYSNYLPEVRLSTQQIVLLIFMGCSSVLFFVFSFIQKMNVVNNKV